MLARFGNFIVEGSGSIGGNTVSKNKGGQYVRKRVKGTNPNTAAQQAVRNKLSELSSEWRGLTDEQRSNWNQSAPDWQYSNRLGEMKVRSGQGLFMTLNASIRAANPVASLLVDPPTPGSVTPSVLSLVTAEFSGGTLSLLEVEFSPTVAANHRVILFATTGLSAGVTRPPKSKFRQIRVLAPAATSPQDLASDYLSVFGAQPVGTRIFVRAVTVLSTTGQRVDSGEVSDIVHAP